MKTKAATDVSLRKRKDVLLTPSRDTSPHRAPSVVNDESQHTAKPPEPQWLGHESEEDFNEAVENFHAYLEILREWDAKEKATHDGPPLSFPDD